MASVVSVNWLPSAAVSAPVEVALQSRSMVLAPPTEKLLERFITRAAMPPAMLTTEPSRLPMSTIAPPVSAPAYWAITPAPPPACT